MKFKKLMVWKRSIKLCIEIYNESKSMDDFSYRNQLTKSGLSIPSNIAEGCERYSIKDGLKFLSYARASCAELNTQIIIGIKIGYIDQQRGKNWLQETTELSAMLSGLIKTRKKLIDNFSTS